MENKKVWFITGAGRGMGVEIAKAALAAGHAVVATGRDTVRLSETLGTSGNLLTVKLDITRLGEAQAACEAPSTDSATSTYSSTTLPTSMPATSRS